MHALLLQSFYRQNQILFTDKIRFQWGVQALVDMRSHKLAWIKWDNINGYFVVNINING